MEIRPVCAGEGLRLRALRLRALADAPDAFGAAYDEVLAYPDAVWQERATPSPGRTTFVAEEDGQWWGMAIGAGGDVPADAPIAGLYSMWVDPAVRRRGVGRALVDAVAGWARARGAGRLELDVVAGNAPAIALYTAAGFAAEGPAHAPLLRAEFRTITMMRPL